MTADPISWRRVMSIADDGASLTVFVFGPLMRLDCRQYKTIQVRRRYYDHAGRCYKTEAALCAHMTKLAKEQQ